MNQNTTQLQIAPASVGLAFEAPYWEGAQRHELVLQRCTDRRLYVHPPVLGAPAWCAGAELEWVSLGSEIFGTVYSYTVIHRAFSKFFVDKVPYVVALCDIDGAPGARVMANVIGVPHEEVGIGLKLKMFWEDLEDGSSQPQWGALDA